MRVLVTPAICLVGLVVSALASKDVVRHLSVLSSHLRSGSWHVNPHDDVLMAHVRAQYAGDPGYYVHSVAASGYQFPLTEQHRRESVNRLGRGIPEPGDPFRLNSRRLHEEYSAFLNESILELARGSVHPDADWLVRLLGSRPDRLSEEEASRAHRLLASQPAYSPLLQAVEVFELGQTSATEFQSFEVSTEPAYDDPIGGWEAGVGELADATDATMRCRGRMLSPTDPGESVPVEVTTFPRARRIPLTRNWLSESLLDAQLEERPSFAERFFGRDGSLRFIPSEIWVQFNDAVTVTVLDADDFEQVRSWNADRIWLTCEYLGAVGRFEFRRMGFTQPPRLGLSGVRLPHSAVLLAVVSKVRALPFRQGSEPRPL